MSARLAPISRVRFVRRFRELGWEGPESGGNHQYMTKGSRTIRVPSYDEIEPGLLRRILNEAGVSRSEWLSVR